MEPVLELEPLVMEPKRVRRLAEVVALDFGLAQVLVRGQGRVLRRVQELEQVEEKRLARMGPTTR
jgi:hypothetical protein